MVDYRELSLYEIFIETLRKLHLFTVGDGTEERTLIINMFGSKIGWRHRQVFFSFHSWCHLFYVCPYSAMKIIDGTT